VSYLIKQCGLTLIELIVVLAIVSVLAAVAVPSYRESISSSKRLEAQTALAALAVAVERHYSAQQPPSYANASASSLLAEYTPIGGNTTSETATYRLCVVDRGDSASGSSCPTKDSATDYALIALPLNAQAADRCGALKLTDTGAKSVSGGSSSEAECWK
jgi:type IV pilus assembly protein PilE